jgi:tripartite-type tricarboxylate transporter receptor subunit TctC
MRNHLRWMILALVAVFLLAACGSGGTGDTVADTGPDGEGTEDTAGAGDIDPETYYEGKTIRFVTSSGAGGGTDAKIRTLASQLQRFIPGNPATQVTNVEPHVAGMNFLWNSEPDGLTIGLTAAPTLEFEFFDEAEWDSSEWTQIGTMDAVCDSMLIVRGDVGFETIEDAIGAEEPVLITMTSAPSPADVEPIALSTMLIADYLEIPLEVKRVAESGTAALNLALERNEINFARYGADWCRMPESNPGWLEDGFVIPILDVATAGPGAQMAAGVEEAPPHVSEVLTEEQYNEWRGLVAASRAGGNPVFMPPGVPDEIANIVRDAFQEGVADEDFVEAMMSAFGGSEIRFLDAEEADQLFTENLEIMTEYNDRFEEITEELYGKYVK